MIVLYQICLLRVFSLSLWLFIFWKDSFSQSNLRPYQIIGILGNLIPWSFFIRNAIGSHCSVCSFSPYVLLLFYCFFILLFWLCPVACGISVPQPEMEPGPAALEELSPNHRATKGVSSPYALLTTCQFLLTSLSKFIQQTFPKCL